MSYEKRPSLSPTLETVGVGFINILSYKQYCIGFLLILTTDNSASGEVICLHNLKN